MWMRFLSLATTYTYVRMHNKKLSTYCTKEVDSVRRALSAIHTLLASLYTTEEGGAKEELDERLPK